MKNSSSGFVPQSQTAEMRSRRRWLRPVAWGVSIAGLFYFAWMVWQHSAVAAWLHQAAPLPFFMSMALLPMVGVPITPFFILAGGIFGMQLGIVGSILALGVNLAGCYVLARKLRPNLEALLRRLGYELPDFRTRETGSVRMTLMVKLAPGIPAFVKNYGLAVAGIGFLPYFVLSLLISGTYGVLVIVLGESLFEHDRKQLLLRAACLAVVVFGVWWWRRRRRSAISSGKD